MNRAISITINWTDRSAFKFICLCYECNEQMEICVWICECRCEKIVTANFCLCFSFDNVRLLNALVWINELYFTNSYLLSSNYLGKRKNIYYIYVVYIYIIPTFDYKSQVDW